MNHAPDPAQAGRVAEMNDPAALSAFLSQSGKTVVFFEMSGCPYCVPYKGRFDELAASRTDLAFARVSLDDPLSPLWERYGIGAVPAFIAFEQGEAVARADSILALGLSRRRWSEFVASL